IPPAAARLSSRSTGRGWHSRSRTLIAGAVSAGVTARFGARGASRRLRGGPRGGAVARRVGAGARQRHRQLRSDLDVDYAGHPGRAEQAGLAPRLPYHAGVDHRAGFDRLERVDLDPAGDERLLLDQALVADDRALIDPGRPHHVRVLAYDAAAQV